MLHQSERVPQHYVLDEAEPATATLKGPPSVELRSTDDSFAECCHFKFEAIHSNVFRTTFCTPQHPIPPYPSLVRPEPSPLLAARAEVTTDVGLRTRVISTGKVKAVVNWIGAPIVSLFLDGAQKPIHRDLHFRSYAVDATGIAHYTVYKKDTLHVGLGEKAAPMDLSGRGFIISASDTFGYDSYRTDPLYKHIPLMINLTPAGCVAIFSTSHARGTWAVGSEIDGMWGHFKVYRQAHGGLEEYLIVGKTVEEVVRSYADLAGFPLLVPRYMMGYVGGGMKYSMEDSPRACDSVLDFIRKCEDQDMPCSAFQLSSGYTVAETEPKTRNVFTWNRHRFPDARAFARDCHRHGVRLLANVKPYVLANHASYPDLCQSGAFFTDPHTKSSAVARLWSAGGGESGAGSHIDFTSRAGYDWWCDGVKALKEVGIDAMWNDNNEFNIPSDDWQCALETIMPPPGVNRKHVGLWGRALHTELMGKASHDATVDAEPGVRPLVLTRSATAGTMRYCASSWSGDNVTSWEGMKGANALALNAGFSLIQCYGHDIGGFEGPQPTPEHLVRWIQLGIHSPRFAINCYKTNPSDNLVGDVIEPWQYPSVSPIIRAAIKRRYELVPYTYSLMLKSHRDAVPPQRWTGWGYESDPTVWSKPLLKGDSQYWFGDALMIAGVYEPGAATARVYLPRRDADDAGFLNLAAPYQLLAAGQWHDISAVWHNSIPVLARIGSAIAIGKLRPTTCVGHDDPEFPNLAKDDWRGVEIFPRPVAHHAGLVGQEGVDDGDSDSDAGPGVGVGVGVGVGRANESSWLEDDGISCEDRAESCEVTVSYRVSADDITVLAALDGRFRPLWLGGGLHVVLPVGEARAVKGDDGRLAEDLGRDQKGRKVWRVDVRVLPGAEKNCASNGASNGLTNAVSNGLSNGLSNGAPNGVSTGVSNGVPNGASNGLSNGLSKGVPNGASNGAPNGS